MDGKTRSLTTLSPYVRLYSQISLNSIGYHAYRQVSHRKQFPTKNECLLHMNLTI